MPVLSRTTTLLSVAADSVHAVASVRCVVLVHPKNATVCSIRIRSVAGVLVMSCGIFAFPFVVRVVLDNTQNRKACPVVLQELNGILEVVKVVASNGVAPPDVFAIQFRDLASHQRILERIVAHLRDVCIDSFLAAEAKA